MIEFRNGEKFICDECPICEGVEHRLELAKEFGGEPQLDYCSCDKIQERFWLGGYCCDAFANADRKNMNAAHKKSGRAYRRKQRRYKRERLKKILSYGGIPALDCSEWKKIGGRYRAVGAYIKYPKNSKNKKFWKAHSNKIVRQNKGGVPSGKAYRRCFDYAWSIY